MFILGSASCITPKSITPIVLGNGSTDNVSNDDDDCGWITVQSATVTSTPRLLYCCPGPKGKKPKCQEAMWMLN